MFRRGPVLRPGPNPGVAMAAGVMVGAAAAGRRAESRAEQAQYQQQQQAQLAQANAEAAAAQQYAASPQGYAAPQPQAYAVASPAAPAPADVGRQMLSTALDGEPGANDLVALKKQLNVVQIMCDQAIGMYRQSLAMLEKAQRTNTTGVVVGAFGRRGVNGIDLAMDAKRDAETKAALQPAEKASQMLVEGFKKIPNALRLRYPAEMSRVGDVPAARLKVGSFGKDILVSAAFGQFGNTMNDVSMMRKIRENEQELQACIAVVNEQKQLMNTVQARLDQDIANLNRAAPATVAAVAMPAATAVPAPPPPAAISGVPPPIAPQNYLELTAPHIVDEHNPAMQQHQIISVPQGTVVKLVRGTLEGGLGAPYNDYIEVEYNGRVGKISRLVVKRSSGNAPLGVPPPLF